MRSIDSLLRVWIDSRKIGGRLRDTLGREPAHKLEATHKSTSCELKNQIYLKETKTALLSVWRTSLIRVMIYHWMLYHASKECRAPHQPLKHTQLPRGLNSLDSRLISPNLRESWVFRKLWDKPQITRTWLHHTDLVPNAEKSAMIPSSHKKSTSSLWVVWAR